MPAFSITPVGPFPSSEDEGFPQFLQFQAEGVDLGGPDVDTVDFTGAGVTVTRGVGENANVLTVDIEGGGGGGGGFTWRTVTDGYTAVADDVGNGLIMAATIGDSSDITIPAGLLASGERIHILNTSADYQIPIVSTMAFWFPYENGNDVGVRERGYVQVIGVTADTAILHGDLLRNI